VKAGPALVIVSAIIVLVALMPGSASAASPVLEFVTPGSSLPVSFTTKGGAVLAELHNFETVVECTGSQGEGEITGPRSTVSKYAFTGCVAQGGAKADCKSESANPKEIRSDEIAAELVYLDQAKHEVGILLNPDGGVYMSFECGGEHVEARGAFLSSIAPINEEASSFIATLTESNAMQTPDEYEDMTGEKHKAIPEGKREAEEWVTTGVASTITVHPSVPVAIRAISAGEVDAKQREAEARQREQRQHEEEAIAAAAAKRHQDEVAAANKHQEEERAASKKREEEVMAALEPAIHSVLTPSGRATKIGALLKHGGLTLAFSSFEPGRLVIQWWQVPPGAHVAKTGKLKPVLVAQGAAVFSGAGVGKVKISLTRIGRRLLAHATKLKLTSRVRFTPAAHSTLSATGVLMLRR